MIKFKMGDVDYLSTNICIENEAGVMNFMPNCARFAGYGNFISFVDSSGHKHSVNKMIVFEIFQNEFLFQELIEE